jgi:serine/threonine protein kinase
VALKILNPLLGTDERFRQRFELEWRTVASIDHPNIIPIYEAGPAGDEVLYIAMRYVDGLDLRRLFYDRGPLEISQVNRIFSQVASALDVAHAHDLVHRDVKPANILVALGAEGEHVYLTDFGITKNRTSLSGLTATDHFLGTPRYMAPEQINKEHIDGRCDQYALACVVYEALAGRLPFQRDNDIALLWAHLAEPPTQLTTLRPELPLEVDGVMMRALAKSPEQRYPSCAAFIADLRDAISGQSVQVYRTPVLPSPGPVPPNVTVPQQAPPTALPPTPPTVPHQQTGDTPPPVVPRQPGPPPYGSPSYGAQQPGEQQYGAQPSTESFTHRSAHPSAHPPTRPVPEPGVGSRPAPGRRRLVLAATSVVAAIGALALALYLVLGAGQTSWTRFEGAPGAPVKFDHPSGWTARTQGDLFVVASPHPAEFAALFGTPIKADWSPVNRIITEDPATATGVYVQVLDTLDWKGDAQQLQDTLQSVLPGPVKVADVVQARVAGRSAARMEGSISDPLGGGRMEFVGFAIDRPRTPALMIYFCVAGSCDDSLVDRVVHSADLVQAG